jgi:hypothetical protein
MLSPAVRVMTLLAVLAAVVSGCERGNGSDAATSGLPEGEHAVIVYLKDISFDEVLAIEVPLEQAIGDAGAGEYDGNEVAVDGSEAILFAYGPDADALWDVMKPIIAEATPNPGSYAIKRYGEASDMSAREVRVEL